LLLNLGLVVSSSSKSSEQQLMLASRAVAAALVETGSSNDVMSGSPNNALVQGDLPGYTGWFRPDTSLAGHFSIVGVRAAVGREEDGGGEPSSSSSLSFKGDGAVVVPVRHRWTVRIRCNHPECRNGGSLFYVRAYGPSILPGRVTDLGIGIYDVSVVFFDPGTYQLEVVLTFSKPPPVASYPLNRTVAYEGYLLPGFPMEVRVPDAYDAGDDARRSGGGLLRRIRERRRTQLSSTGIARQQQPNSRLCETRDLLETGPDSAVERGRWLVTRKVAARRYSSDLSHHEQSLRGYQVGDNSIGFRADYVPTDCALISDRQVRDADILLKALESSNIVVRPSSKSNLESKSSPYRQPIRVIFIGDSNMRIQRDYFNDNCFGGALYTELIDTSGGIAAALPSIRQRLEYLKAEANSTNFVIFNTGLHDLDRLCVFKDINMNHSYVDITKPGFSCFELYAKTLDEFVDVVKAFPSALTVWQSTSAGWPKWGVYGAAWNPRVRQIVQLSPNAVESLNAVAWEVVAEKKGVPVMDYYWLTLSRPDNRQIDEENRLTQHLVHPGLEVLSAVARKWATMILEAIRDYGETGQA